MAVKAFLFIVTCVSACLGQSIKLGQDSSRLLETLLDGYDVRVRPTRNLTQPVSVHVDVSLIRIIKLVSLGVSKRTLRQGSLSEVKN